MAGAGYKLFSTGDVLTASDVNTYLQQQTVMVFADASARTTALSGVVSEGMISYLKDTNAVEVYNGSAWVASDDPNAIQNTIVDAKGDLITATSADTPARLAVGNNGETLVADSSASTGLRWQGNYAAGKNKIINGDFSIWQRGTSFTTPANGAYTADRYKVAYNGSGSTFTISQQTFTPGTAPVAGYEGQFFLRKDVTVAGSGETVRQIRHVIEDVRTFAGQTVTVSFWAKADSARTLSMNVTQNFGSGGSASVGTAASSGASLTTAWTRFERVINVPSISGKTIGTGSNLEFRFDFPLNSVFTIDIWGVQLEAGSVATAFQTATGTLAGELAACQRYYWRQNAGSNAFGNLSLNGATTSTTNAEIYIQAPISMRVTPTAVDFSTLRISPYASALGALAVTAATLSARSNDLLILVNCTVSGAVDDTLVQLQANNSTSAYIGFSAEL